MTDTLDAVYEQIPDVSCKGLCHDQCTVVPVSPAESDRAAAAGVRLPLLDPRDARRWLEAGEAPPCPALSAFGRCRVYDARPTVCRLYGATEGLRCPHGCEPANGLLPAEQASVLFAESLEAG